MGVGGILDTLYRPELPKLETSRSRSRFGEKEITAWMVLVHRRLIICAITHVANAELESACDHRQLSWNTSYPTRRGVWFLGPDAMCMTAVAF